SGLNYLWYGSAALNGIVRSSTTGASKVFLPIPTSNAAPFGVVVGPDKRIWFTEWNGSSLGAMTSNGKFTEYPLGFGPTQANDLKVGADKNLWLPTDFNGIVRVTTTGGVAA